MTELIITKQEENQRLDKFLMKYMNKAPKSFVYKMLRKKRIKYNKKKAEGNEILCSGDVIQLYLAEETVDNFQEEKKIVEVRRQFGIVYEDDNLLAVMKPAGVLTHPERAEDRNTLIDQILFYLKEKGEYAGGRTSFTPAVCNRLDRNTSGIILSGKNLMAVQELNRIIREREIKKLYVTVVKGVIIKPQELRGYWIKDEDNNLVKITSDQLEETCAILTRLRPLSNNGAYTLLEIELVTGKSHQIRAHLASIGHPIVGTESMET